MKNPKKLFPMIVTAKLAETKKFYTEQANFSIVHDLEGYLQLRYGADEGAPEICFMAPDAMKDMPEWPSFSGSGLVVSVPTKSADTKAEELRKAGVKDVPTPENKPWGWRSFLVPDPNGVLLDFFHVVDASPMAPQS